MIMTGDVQTVGVEDAAWQRRVLPLTDYVAELHSGVKVRAFDGTSFAPIPVPLLDGETVVECEEAFIRMLTKGQKLRLNRSPSCSSVLGLRVHFARRRARWLGRNRDQAQATFELNELDNVDLEQVPRTALYAIKYVSESEYVEEIHIGLFRWLKAMPRAKCYTMFGTVLPPVYMPRLLRETQPECEARFATWLRETKARTEDELTCHLTPLEERRYRIEFAAEATRIDDKAKVKSQATHVPTTDDEASRRCAVWELRVLPLTELAGHANPSEERRFRIEFAATTGVMSEKSEVVEKYKIDQQMRAHKKIKIEITGRGCDGCSSADTVEVELVREYEAINERVVINENALEESAAHVAAAPVTDVRETSCFLAENEAMSVLIDHEICNRNAALAVLIVFMWREDVTQLRTMVNDPLATNVLHIHRASHHKCTQLPSQIKDEQKRLEELKTKARSSRDQKIVGSAKRKLKQLMNQRRREFVRIIHFDENVRLLIQELLARV